MSRIGKRVFLYFLLAAPAGAQSAGASHPAADALAEQRRAVSAMQASLERQRAAVRRQSHDSSSGGFFTLSPPPVTGMPPAASPLAAAPTCDPVPAPEMTALIDQAAASQGLDQDLLRAVTRQESGFRPCAVSPKGALGLMQLMPGTAAELGVRNPFDPEENLTAGARLLRQLLTRYGDDPKLALGAYNAGPAAVDRFGAVPPFPETIDYVQRILFSPYLKPPFESPVPMGDFLKP